jgi:hypothetical protein
MRLSSFPSANVSGDKNIRSNSICNPIVEADEQVSLEMYIAGKRVNVKAWTVGQLLARYAAAAD